MFSKTFKKLREDANITQKDLASIFHVSQQAIGKWETGRALPSSDLYPKIADYFNVSIDYLYGREVEVPSNAIPYEPTGMVPVLGRIPAGDPLLAEECIEGYEPVDVADPQNYYFLRVQGDSMINAGIQSGDLVLIRLQNYAENGQIVACRVNGDEATLKRFREQEDCVILLPENPAYEPRIINKKDFADGYAAIMGIAVEVKRKLL